MQNELKCIHIDRNTVYTVYMYINTLLYDRDINLEAP